MKLEGWFFSIGTKTGMDAHTTLVIWLRKRGLSHLFTPEKKCISYFTMHMGGEEFIFAKSCVEIKDPIVKHRAILIKNAQEVRFIVRVYASKIQRNPNLKYEIPTKSHTIGNKLIPTSKEHVAERLKNMMKSMGVTHENAEIDTLPMDSLEVFHKGVGKMQKRHYQDAVVKASIQDVTLFENAWKYGVGSKRVYGFGCIRVLLN